MGRGRVDPELRDRARALRLDGCSYREISTRLGGVPKSTLSAWLRDVPLTDEHRAALEGRRSDGARSRAVAMRAGRVRRTEVLQAAAAAEIGELSDRELFLIGVALYWAEGTKAKPWSVSEGVKFINSDADVIRVFLAWLRLLGVPDADVQLNLSIHERADVAAASNFWGEVVGRPTTALGRPWLKRHNPKPARRNTGDAYVGCLVVNLRRSTDLNRRIAGWWAGIARSLPS